MTKISICLPVYNGAEHMEEALSSIAAQSTRDFVVLASDNASSDRTAEILARWSRCLPIEIVTHPQTIPMFANFNSLLDRVQTDHFMMLCHDDYFCSPDALTKALDAMQAHPEVSAVYCDLAYVSEHGRRLAYRRFSRSGMMEADALGRQCLRTARSMFGIPLLVRRRASCKSRYDQQFRYMADVDLSWTISKQAPAWHIPEVLLANRYHGGNSTWTLLSGVEAEFLRLARKHGVDLSAADRRRLRLTNWKVMQQKRAFRLYERLITGFGR